MSSDFPKHADEWLLEEAPQSAVVVSSRARLARNLPGHPFAPRAKADQLGLVADKVAGAMAASDYFSGYERFELSELDDYERRFLRESHLISADLEKGRENCNVYLNSDARTSIMVNEEDHLRIQTMLAGLRVREVHAQIAKIEEELEKSLEFAYSPSFGYLTACPTNTGTGLRVSVMLHLVGLVVTNQVEEALNSLNNFGLVVRGAYGEHSNHTGDLFQVSNEVTLGKTEEDLVEILDQVVTQIIQREDQAREMFLKHAGVKCEDTVQRALGLLRHARSIESSEAVVLLSRLRLGLGRDFGPDMSHEQLNRLIVDVQPAHLRRTIGRDASVEDGDVARATLLRARMDGNGMENKN